MTYGLPALERDLQTLAKLLETSEEMQHALGQAGKEAATTEARKALGPDRSFSGLKRKHTLGSGYDLGNPVILNLRPAGLWFLAEDGRKRRGRIDPKRARRRQGRAAVSTPLGPRHYSSYGPTRGKQVITKLEDRLEKELPEAALEGLDAVAKQVFGR